MGKSKIEWTEKTWNPSIGCTKISAGCKNCYAEVMANRLKAMGNKDYSDGFKFKVLPYRIDYPLSVKKSTIFFVNSMSDLFHEDIPISFLEDVFQVMSTCNGSGFFHTKDNKWYVPPSHIFQVLTKRPERINMLFEPWRYGGDGGGYYGGGDYNPNIWLGTSVENKENLKRIDDIRKYDGFTKFLSIEPLLERLGKINLGGIDWVIVGGESGHGARRMDWTWVADIHNQCKEAGVKFFFKQWGAYGEDGKLRSKKANGRSLFGREFNEMPEVKF